MLRASGKAWIDPTGSAHGAASVDIDAVTLAELEARSGGRHDRRHGLDRPERRRSRPTRAIAETELEGRRAEPTDAEGPRGRLDGPDAPPTLTDGRARASSRGSTPWAAVGRSAVGHARPAAQRGTSVTTIRRPSVRSQPRLANEPIAWLTLCREPPAISASWLWLSSMVIIGAWLSPASRTSVLATRPGRSRKTWSAFCSVSRRISAPSERITASRMRGLECTSSMNARAGQRERRAVLDRLGRRRAGRAVQQRHLAEHVGRADAPTSTARSPVGAVRKTATAPRLSTISDSPGSFSTNSSWPLR